MGISRAGVMIPSRFLTPSSLGYPVMIRTVVWGTDQETSEESAPGTSTSYSTGVPIRTY
jgi:hypothetical protein